jgi:branched-chain amino acid transport system ATP-binding protein
MPVLEVCDLHKNFGQLRVLSGLQLAAYQGDIIGLVGPNGSGKTTLLNLVSGFQSIDRGTINVGGTDISSWPTWRRPHAGIGRCFQDSRLWNDLSVDEHLLVVAHTHETRQASGRMAALIGHVGLDARMLGKYPDDISLLDRRLVELILASFSGSHLLLLDEITAGLNLTEARVVYDCVSTLVRQHLVGAVLMIEHRLGLVEEYATTIGMMKDGQLVQTQSVARGDFADAIQDMFDTTQIKKKEIPKW